MTPFDFRPRTRVVFGSGEFARLGEIARARLGACWWPILELFEPDTSRKLPEH